MWNSRQTKPAKRKKSIVENPNKFKEFFPRIVWGNECYDCSGGSKFDPSDPSREPMCAQAFRVKRTPNRITRIKENSTRLDVCIAQFLK